MTERAGPSHTGTKKPHHENGGVFSSLFLSLSLTGFARRDKINTPDAWHGIQKILDQATGKISPDRAKVGAFLRSPLEISEGPLQDWMEREGQYTPLWLSVGERESPAPDQRSGLAQPLQRMGTDERERHGGTALENVRGSTKPCQAQTWPKSGEGCLRP